MTARLSERMEDLLRGLPVSDLGAGLSAGSEFYVSSHVALDGPVVDDAGGGYVFEGETLAGEDGYVLGPAAALHLSGDDLTELVDGFGEDQAGL
jgi:hypothetical protein